MKGRDSQKAEEARVFAESIIETIREPLIVLEYSLYVVSANRAFYETFQVKREAVEGHRIYSLGNNQWDIPALRELLEKIIPENEVFDDFEVEHDFPEIGHRIMHLNARKIEQQGTRQSLILLAIDDVTERIETRQALEKSQARYHGLVEKIKSIIIAMNTDGVITFFNKFSEKLFGYRREEMIGKKLVGTLLPEEDSEGTDNTDLIADLLQDPDRFYLNESIGLRKDGKEVWFSWSARKMENPEENVTEILIDGNDITGERVARRQAQDAHRIINASGSAIFLVDTGKKCLFANRAFAEMVGKRVEEVEGEMLDHMGLPEYTRDQFSDALNAAIDRQAEQISELAYGDRHLLVRVEPEYEKDDRISGYMVFANDITDSKKIEEQLYQARKMEAIGRLATGVAHEFNNMINVIHGNAELLRFRLEKDSPLQDYIREIATTARRTSNLSDQLHAYSRQQTGTPGKIDLNHEIVTRLNILETLSDEALDLHFHPEKSVLPTRIDPDHLEQVLIILMDNARDAKARSVTITTDYKRLESSSAEADLPPGDYVRLSFADNGSGMSRDIRERIFDPFFTTRDVGRGTGLGLSTVLGIVKQNDGGITVESEPDRGSTFHIYLPRSNETESTG